jgi:hypothetical protein
MRAPEISTVFGGFHPQDKKGESWIVLQSGFFYGRQWPGLSTDLA